MAGTVYAINVVLTDGDNGYLKFNGDGTWRWHMVYDVNEATLYRSKDECLQDFYRHVKNAKATDDSGVRVDRDRCRISECYCPWL
jgi:hypothetical protein